MISTAIPGQRALYEQAVQNLPPKYQDFCPLEQRASKHIMLLVQLEYQRQLLVLYTDEGCVVSYLVLTMLDQLQDLIPCTAILENKRTLSFFVADKTEKKKRKEFIDFFKFGVFFHNY